jgi:hypothetical protein
VRIYIASGLDNLAEAKRVADMLEDLGHIITYRWFDHGPAGSSIERLQEVSVKEVEGVRSADVVLVLLPGGRGTHVELGGGLLTNKPVIIWDYTRTAFTVDNTTCAFYWHPNVYRVEGSMNGGSLLALMEVWHSVVMHRKTPMGALEHAAAAGWRTVMVPQSERALELV